MSLKDRLFGISAGAIRIRAPTSTLNVEDLLVCLEGRPTHRRGARRFRKDLYLYSPKGAQYTADGLRARWGRWLADTPEGRVICRRWKEWVGAQVKKYDWDIDPDDADHPTIHGLRGTGILARAEEGYEMDQIANDIGMSARTSSITCGFPTRWRSAPTAISNFVLSTRRTRPRTQARLYGPCKSPGLQNSWP